jgi:hypothetical protein
VRGMVVDGLADPDLTDMPCLDRGRLAAAPATRWRSRGLPVLDSPRTATARLRPNLPLPTSVRVPGSSGRPGPRRNFYSRFQARFTNFEPDVSL